MPASTPAPSSARSAGRTSGFVFDLRQTLSLVVIGVVLWFLAAVLLRVLAPYGIYEGFGRVLLYALIIPGTVPFLLSARWIAGIPNSTTGLGVAVMVAAATLCDGVALAWFPALYGTEVAQIAGAGAAILWGAGVALVLGFLLSTPDRA